MRPTVNGSRVWRPVPELGKVAESGSMLSIWVGLGGWLLWMDSIAQLGSEHAWNRSSNPIHRRGCQWCDGKNRPGEWLSQIVRAPAINPGQEIICHLAVLDDRRVEFYFLNNCMKETSGVRARGERPVVSTTAEWVVERP